MGRVAALPIVPFREVRHFQPDDCLHYESVGVRGKIHGWNIPMHAHEALYQFEFLERGSVVARLDDTSHSLKAPAAWALGPETIHGFSYRPGSAGHVVTIPSTLMDAGTLELAELLARPVVLDAHALGGRAKGLLALFKNLAREFDVKRPRRVEALQAHATLLAVWFARHDGNRTAQARSRNQDELIARFRGAVEAHFRNHWTIADYARHLKVTPDHLSRRCRTATGQSALDLVQERMVLEARRLLAHTPMPVSDIAHQLGYDDPAYFSRFFAKSAGQSPSAYRDALADGVGPWPQTRQ